MTEQEKQPEKKHFYLSVINGQYITDGNMPLEEVSAALIALAVNAGYNQAKKEEPKKD